MFKGNKSFPHSSPNEPPFLFPILTYKIVLGTYNLYSLAFWLLSGLVLCPDHGVPGLKAEPLWSSIKPVYLFEVVYLFILFFSYKQFFLHILPHRIPSPFHVAV